MKILLARENYTARSQSVSGQFLQNLYSEDNPEGSKYPFTLYNTPGLKNWANLETLVAVNGLQVMGDLLYAFSNNKAYKIDLNKNVTQITGDDGALSGTVGRLDLANNGSQILAITPDGEGFLIDDTDVTQITDSDFPVASSVTFLDGYFIVTEKDTQKFFISGLYDGSTWDALDFASAEEAPDNLVRVFSFNNALWLYGNGSIEPHYNSGNADFPFEQIQGAANTTRGLGAKFSVVDEDSTMFFIGDDRIIYKINQYAPLRISNHAIESEIQDYNRIDDAFAFSYTQDGHKFVVFTFPNAGKTHVYDISNGRFHLRKSEIAERWRPNCHAFFNGKNIVGDYTNGKLYELDMNTYKDDDQLVTRIVQGAVNWKDGERITYDMVRLDIDAGLAGIVGQGSDPQVIMKYSDDGKKTWSNEKWVSMGKIGQFFKRVIWRRMGTARERIFEFKIKDDVPTRITGCYVNPSIGDQ
jgi:hypothetical protein